MKLTVKPVLKFTSVFFLSALVLTVPSTHAEEAKAPGAVDQPLIAANQAIEADPSDSGHYAARAALFDERREFAKAVADYDKLIALTQTAAAHQRRGEDLFRLSRFVESVADFDRVIALEPEREPYHWQRGIALYYAGEFSRGAKQFELHKSVNPNDVENAAWHFLCVARASGIDAARKGLIHIDGDGRVPMMTVFAMFGGSATPEDVLKAAEAGTTSEHERAHRRFYARLYLGLYLEAIGKSDEAGENIRLAEKYASDDYMGDVARVHARQLKTKR